MKKINSIIGISLSLVLMCSPLSSFAIQKTMPSKALAYIKPNFTIQVEEQVQLFKDVNGQRLYPLVYDGSTYLPVRAVSALMEEEIEWENSNRTVYIGKTLTNPNKSQSKKNTEESDVVLSVDKDKYVMPTEKTSTVTVNIRPDITIMYDFNIQRFEDVSGNRIYPIIYEGSTYLPVRAISELMGEEIRWDNVTKTITIGKPEEEEEKPEIKEPEEEKPKEEKPEEEKPKSTEATAQLKAELESAIDLYDQATDKIVGIQKTTDPAMKVIIAKSISADVLSAQKQTLYINSLKTPDITEAEAAAQTALYEFAQISEYYLLVLENISYLAARNEDYSMLAETFYNFAMDSQNKLNIARKLIGDLEDIS